MTTIGRELDSEKVYADEIDASEGRLDKIRAAKKLRKSQKGAGNNHDDDIGDLELGESSGQDFGRRRPSGSEEEDGKEDGGVTSGDSPATGDAETTQQQISSNAASDVSGKDDDNNESQEPDIEKNETTDATKAVKADASSDPKKDDDSANNVTMGMAVVDSQGKKDAQKEESSQKVLALQEQEPIVQLSFYVAVVSFGLACLVALVMVILLATVGTS